MGGGLLPYGSKTVIMRLAEAGNALKLEHKERAVDARARLCEFAKVNHSLSWKDLKRSSPLSSEEIARVDNLETLILLPLPITMSPQSWAARISNSETRTLADAHAFELLSEYVAQSLPDNLFTLLQSKTRTLPTAIGANQLANSMHAKLAEFLATQPPPSLAPAAAVVPGDAPIEGEGVGSAGAGGASSNDDDECTTWWYLIGVEPLSVGSILCNYGCDVLADATLFYGGGAGRKEAPRHTAIREAREESCIDFSLCLPHDATPVASTKSIYFVHVPDGSECKQQEATPLRYVQLIPPGASATAAHGKVSRRSGEGPQRHAGAAHPPRSHAEPDRWTRYVDGAGKPAHAHAHAPSCADAPSPASDGHVFGKASSAWGKPRAVDGAARGHQGEEGGGAPAASTHAASAAERSTVTGTHVDAATPGAPAAPHVGAFHPRTTTNAWARVNDGKATSGGGRGGGGGRSHGPPAAAVRSDAPVWGRNSAGITPFAPRVPPPHEPFAPAPSSTERTQGDAPSAKPSSSDGV